MKKFMRVNERRERERNIVIKGELKVGENLDAWVNELLADRLGLNVKIEAAWRTGKVIIAKLSSVEERRRVMANKSKLAGTKIFIESDLSYEERKVQEEIGRWARCKKDEGIAVRVGVGKVWIGNRWVRWEDKKALTEVELRLLGERGVEKGGNKDVSEEKQDGEQNGETGQDFN